MTRLSLLALLLAAGCPSVGDATFEARVDGDGDGARAEMFGGGDCNDTDPAIGPAVEELWYDGVDQDCDGASDFDQDGDGWDREVEGGGPSDCDDEDATVHPDAAELCDGVDQDCVDATGGEEDADGDGWRVCAEDCDDGDAGVNPYALERCDAADQDEDCDGLSDDDDDRPEGLTLWYPDEDDDGYGDPEGGREKCDQPAGFTADASDCDDGDPELTPQTVWHPDADGDGWGDAAAATIQCVAPADSVRDGSDCDDTSLDVHPGAIERCNDVDDDCDGLVDADDDGVDPSEALWYRDADGDGAGDAMYRVVSCAQSATYVHVAGDCDDDDAASQPGGTETCDLVDNDCDGLVDDADPDIVDRSRWYVDTDADDWGDSAEVTLSCVAPSGSVAAPGDCDDLDPDAHPNAPETCDGLDEDCDGLVDGDDPDVTGQTLWYADADRDAWGETTSGRLSCEAPTGFVALEGDCDDTEGAVNPGAEETCATPGDDDCDGVANADDAVGCASFGRDEDGDGFGQPDVRCLCMAEDVWTATDDGDCDDSDPAVRPGATETCATTVDDDCDGIADALDAPGCAPWYLDTDGDQHGVATSECRCAASGAFAAAVSDDCDDAAADVWPGAPVSCLDGVSQDCDDAPDTCSLTDANATFAGEVAADLAGAAVRAATDFDGDGLPDFLVAALNDETVGAQNGATYVVSGATRGTASLSDAIAKLTGPADGYGGDVLASLGDVDGDGYGDIVLGAYGANERSQEGAAYLFSGPFSGTRGVGAADETLIGESYGDYAGFDVADAGDTDGDGLADILVGSVLADWNRPSAGQVSVVTGPATGLRDLGDATANLWGSNTSDYLGYAVAGLGDIDGDGLADIAMGAPNADQGGTNTGLVYLLRGPMAGFGRASSFADATIVGASDMFVGGVVTGVGDLDGDGLGDVGTVGSGLAHVYAGTSTGTLAVGASMARIAGTASVYAFDDAGDVDGDGAADLVVGAPYEDSAGVNAGAVFIVLGTLSGVIDLDSCDSRVLGIGTGDYAGYSVAGIGDVDGDGLGDVAVGAPDATYASAGFAHLLLGG